MIDALRVAALALAVGVGPVALAAQPLPSEHALVAQTVAGTTIQVEYYRPVARGRELFGKLVPWGVPWTPGANWATTIDVDHAVRVNGTPLPRGKYTVFAIPERDAWTVILDRRTHIYHTQRPRADEEQLRLVVKPEAVPPTEVLTWWFPLVARDAATLRMQWGTTGISLEIGTTSEP